MRLKFPCQTRGTLQSHPQPDQIRPQWMDWS